MDDDFEKLSSRCNSLADLRKKAAENPGFTEAVADSVSPVKVLLTDIFIRLELQSKKFSVFSSASSGDIALFWDSILAIDSTLEDPLGKYTKATLTKTSNLRQFFDHCCHTRHYTFSVLKCGDSACSVCKPTRLPLDVFSTLKHLPDPTLQDNGHYKPFKDVLGMKTTEDDRPSNKKSREVRKGPFVPSIQHAKNTNLMVQCEECLKWRLVYSRYKLSGEKRATLEQEFSFSCGCDLNDLGLDEVFVRDVTCSDHVEKLYYSLGHEPICVYCSEPIASEDTDQSDCPTYPQCAGCKDLPGVHKYGKNFK